VSFFLQRFKNLFNASISRSLAQIRQNMSKFRIRSDYRAKGKIAVQEEVFRERRSPGTGGLQAKRRYSISRHRGSRRCNPEGLSRVVGRACAENYHQHGENLSLVKLEVVNQNLAPKINKEG
jgi:hypothetical protein